MTTSDCASGIGKRLIHSSSLGRGDECNSNCPLTSFICLPIRSYPAYSVGLSPNLAVATCDEMILGDSSHQACRISCNLLLNSFAAHILEKSGPMFSSPGDHQKDVLNHSSYVLGATLVISGTSDFHARATLFHIFEPKAAL
jgi:hypothetical protein